jgi:hypothetical protein
MNTIEITYSDEQTLDELLEEIGTYLAAVDVFRAVGCEPAWEPERQRQP